MNGGGLLRLIIAYDLGILANSLVCLYFAQRFVRPKFHFDLHYSRQMVREALPLGLAVLIITAYGRIDIVLLKWFTDSATVGYYSFAYRAVDLAFPLSFFFVGSVFPLLCAPARRRESCGRFRALYQRSHDVLSLGGLAVVTGLILFSEPIVQLIGGVGVCTIRGQPPGAVDGHRPHLAFEPRRPRPDCRRATGRAPAGSPLRPRGQHWRQRHPDSALRQGRRRRRHGSNRSGRPPARAVHPEPICRDDAVVLGGRKAIPVAGVAGVAVYALQLPWETEAVLAGVLFGVGVAVMRIISLEDIRGSSSRRPATGGGRAGEHVEVGTPQ